MISGFITWTCDPVLISAGPFHISSGVLMLGILICIVWAVADHLRSTKALKKWKEAGAKPQDKPQDGWTNATLAAVIGVVLIYLRMKNPQGFYMPVTIRWYGFMFLIGFIAGYRIMWRMFRHEGAREEWLPTLLFYVIIATIVGARLGHCLFYDWDYYSSHPGDIVKVWEGGLASHGGTIGIILAILLYSKLVTKRSPLWTLDRLCVPVALVACLIRLGNLFNSEIFGHATTLPWGFKFPLSAEWRTLYGPDLACHPTQLYEAGAYLLLFGLLMWLYWRKNAEERPGLLLGVFFIGTFLSRLLIEFVKNPQEEFENNMILNMGQLLSVPFILAGILLVYFAMKRPRKQLTFPNKFPEPASEPKK